ncbi:MAG TPA: arylsulfatase [Chitinophagaceae bacterium]|nr:arylsulfatase [Chitinophagaceae bacterium]
MPSKINPVLLILLLLIISNSVHPQSKQNNKPNILLIVADDLGYTDPGCYGGDIKTPNIDRLAKQGLQFTNFHTSPLCAPTRAMLLSGNDNHVAGIGSMFPVRGTPREGKPGYEGHLSDRIVTVAQLLKDGGYQTFMAGKWHVGFDDPYIPYAKGFGKSFVLLNGGATHFNNNPIFENEPPQYRQDNETVLFPEGKYSTDVYTEKMIGFIKDRQAGRPFFALLTYTSPHWPLQVPAEYMDKYKGRYDMGYDSLRVLRFNQQKAMGIIPSNATLPSRAPQIKLWTALSPEEKKIESRKMELYAAMVEHLDERIGDVIQYLVQSGQLDNTIIVFMSDNGAAAEDFYNRPAGFGPFLQKHYNNDYENMGKASSFVSYGPQWAQAGAAPFKLFKYYSTEGGIVTPLIITGKHVARKPGLQNTFITVLDLAPTFLEIAGIKYPEYHNNKKMTPMLGESFLPFISGKTNTVHGSNYVFGLEHDGQCMLIKGNWKITNISQPFDESAFALYNLTEDIGESNDLSKSNPEKFSEMMKEWEVFKKKTGVIPKEK